MKSISVERKTNHKYLKLSNSCKDSLKQRTPSLHHHNKQTEMHSSVLRGSTQPENRHEKRVRERETERRDRIAELVIRLCPKACKAYKFAIGLMASQPEIRQ